VTFRLRVPVGRAGQRVRLAFRSGDGELVLRKATVAKAGPDGSLASAPVTVTFSGASGFSVGKRVRVVSDPVPFAVGFRDELAVSFEVQGALAVSAIMALPGSYVRSGAYASVQGPLGEGRGVDDGGRGGPALSRLRRRGRQHHRGLHLRPR
jgi:hypothetical protein